MHDVMLPFQLVVTPDAPGVYVKVRGRLVHGPSSDLQLWRPALEQSAGRMLTLDLCGVDEIDAAGVGLLVALHEEALRRGGDVSIASAGRRVRELLSLTRTAHLFAPYARQGAAAVPPCDRLPDSYFWRRTKARDSAAGGPGALASRPVDRVA